MRSHGTWSAVGAVAAVAEVVAACGLASAAGPAQTTSQPAAAAAIERGRATYREHCAVCHGDRGRGDGPAAASLTPRPTNLTTMTRVTGAFPGAHIAATIKGTDPVVAHGNPGMMIWGAIFLADANGSQARADERVNDLVRFIESIQVK